MTLKLLFLSTTLLLGFFSCPALAGGNFTNVTGTTTFLSFDSLSSSPINKKEQERRQELIKKIDEIQRQFEEAERLSYIGLSKEEIEEMYRKAVEVLTGAMVVCSSEVIN